MRVEVKILLWLSGTNYEKLIIKCFYASFGQFEWGKMNKMI